LNTILALSFLIISGIIWRYSNKESDKFFAVTALLFGYILAMGWPGIQLSIWISLPLVILYFFCYPQAFLSFLYFSYQFPASTLSKKTLKIRQFILISLGLGLSGILIVLFLRKYFNPAQQTITEYHGFYRFFRTFILLSLLLSLGLFMRNLKREPTPVNRKKVQWVWWGIIWGSFPFIFLWNLPQIFGMNPLVPEWIFVIFLLLTPASVAIAILRYRLFDIEIVLSRSLVYTFVLIALIGIYLFFVGSLSLLLHQQFSFYRYPFVSIIAAVGLALAFNPIKTRIQTLVDKRFFRIRYDRFQMLHEFMGHLTNFTSKSDILKYLSETFARINPLQDELIFIKKLEQWKHIGDRSATAQAHIEWIKQNKRSLPEQLVLNQNQSHKVEEGLKYTRIKLPEPAVIFVPINKFAVWILGKKRADTRFWKEDIDLIQELTQAAKLQLEKIEYIELSLFESLQKERAEKEAEITRLRNVELKEKNIQLKQLLKELRETQGELIQSEKMAALGKLVAGVVHEINSPIGALNSASDLANRITSQIKKLRESLVTSADSPQLQKLFNTLDTLEDTIQVIIAASERISKMVNSLKSIAHLDAPSYQEVDLHQNLDHTLNLLKEKMGSRIKIKKKYGFVPLITCYPADLNQVFMHLLTNAA
ncbi:MAG: hypothetical protein ACW99Q_29155, partial [Candidatus Kariarchaeaceae archaeon]